MKTIAANDIRRDFTEIANKVKYAKESYIVTNQNKPSVGIVPLEFIKLFFHFKEIIANDKKLAKLFKDYVTFITEEDIEFLDKINSETKKPNQTLQAAAESLKGKLKDF